MTLSAKVRNGYQSRESALKEYSIPVKEDENLIYYVKKRLGISDKEYDDIFAQPNRSWKDYKTYKKRFEFLRPLFYILAKNKRVPMSFYLKYCFPLSEE